MEHLLAAMQHVALQALRMRGTESGTNKGQEAKGELPRPWDRGFGGPHLRGFSLG